MSTDDAAPRRRWSRRVVALILLALAAAALAGANLAQGPKLREVEANPDLLVARDAGRVVLRLSQPSVLRGEVTVEPATPIDASLDGSALAVRFEKMLDSGTDYRLTARIASAYTGAERIVTATVRTPAARASTLARSDAGDRILDYRLGAEASPLVEAPRIQEYLTVPDGVLAIAATGDGGGSRILAEGVPDPAIEMERLGLLRGDARSGMAGVVGTDGRGHERTLILFDPASPRGSATPVTAPGGDAIPVRDWRFVPGTTAVALLTDGGELLVRQTLPAELTVPLGRVDEILGFVPGSSRLVLRGDGELRILDLSRAPYDSADDVPQSVPVTSIDPGGVRAMRSELEAVAVAEDHAAGGGERLVLRTPDGDRPLFAPASERTRIGEVCLSPNAEYLSVETTSAEGRPDGYPEEERLTHTTTQFVRIDDARAIGSSIGAMSSWCR